MESFMHRLLWGLVVIAVGAVFLLNHLGVITMGVGEFFSTFWPVFVILFGLQGMLLQKGGAFWWNPFVVLIGCLFLGRNLEWFDWDLSDMIQLLWPIALILFGVSMIFKGGRGARRNESDGEQWNTIVPPEPPVPPVPPMPPIPPGPPPAPPADGEPFSRPEAPPPPSSDRHSSKGEFDQAKREWKERMESAKQEWKQEWKGAKREWKQHARYDWRHMHGQNWHGHGKRSTHSRFIGDVYFGHDYWELTPMNISHFIGDTTIDLTKAQVPMGETNIEVSSFIGDVKVFVPNDSRIGVQVVSSCLIGDVKVLDQKRGGLFNHISVESPGFADAEHRVILVVSSFIGDVRVMKVG